MNRSSHSCPEQNLDGGGYGGRLTIDLGALQHNYRLLVARAGQARVCCVVKADAYGVGVHRVAPALYAVGCRCFFVAQAVEAFSLRHILPVAADIGILNDFQPGEAEKIADARLIPVLNSLESIAEWIALCRARRQRLAAILQLDSGMSRLGLDAQALERLVADPVLFQLADIRYIMSHLACAEEKENPQNQMQLDYLRRALRRLPPTPVSFANSGGLFLGSRFAFDMVRPGIALYGVQSSQEKTDELHPVIALEARVIQTRQVEAGGRVGYGGSYQAASPMRVATIAVGYGDGWPRTLSNIGAAFWQGIRLPVIGHVSMDSTTLDISSLPQNTLKRGDGVELIGAHQTVGDVARDAGTIPYEILTNLGRRYERHYING